MAERAGAARFWTVPVTTRLLFGGLAVWALVNMVLINARDGAWVRPEPGPLKGDLRLAIIALVLYGVIAAIHTWLGYPVFPG